MIFVYAVNVTNGKKMLCFCLRIVIYVVMATCVAFCKQDLFANIIQSLHTQQAFCDVCLFFVIINRIDILCVTSSATFPLMIIP